MTDTQIESLVDTTLRALPADVVVSAIQEHLDMLDDLFDDDPCDFDARPTLTDAIDSFNDDFHGWAHEEQVEFVAEMFAEIVAATKG